VLRSGLKIKSDLMMSQTVGAKKAPYNGMGTIGIKP
jgi:hypothetical protein